MANEPPNPFRNVRLAIDNSEEAPAPAREADMPRGSGGSGDNPNTPDLPPNFPVTVLGKRGAAVCLLDGNRQYREEPQLARHVLSEICAEHNAVLFHDAFARKNDKGDIVGFRPERWADAIYREAGRRGLFDTTCLCGRGARVSEDGALLLHCGDVIFDRGAALTPGLHGDLVFPAGTPIMRPSDGPARTVASGEGAEILALLRAWHWRRGEIDARLLLGWIAAGLLGGALAWRPVIWVTGAKNTGKSTLQTALANILGGWMLAVSDPSAAGIWQTLRYDTLPVWVDEAEAEEDNRKGQAIVKLARQAASGGIVLRGGADHKAERFMARSCFAFSSILVPPLLGQDRSRLALLELLELKGRTPPDITPARLRVLGRQMLRRLIDQWPRFDQAFAQYEAALQRVGHNRRTIDVFGTLLACGDLLLNDEEVDSDSAEELAAQLDIAAIAEGDDDARDEDRWREHLLTTAIPLDGPGTKRSIAEWIRIGVTQSAFEAAAQEADLVLGNHGLKIVRPRDGTKPSSIAIANSHAGLARLHLGTHWGARSGTMGVWVQAARRLPGAERSGTLRFANAPLKGTLIALATLFPDGIEEPGTTRAAMQRSFEDAGE